MASFLGRMRGSNGANGSKTEKDATQERKEPVMDTPPAAPVFAADSPDGADYLGMAPLMRRMAELVCHARTQGPLRIGLFGPAGSGKSFALARLCEDAGKLSDGARDLSGASPFLPRLVTARVDASQDGEAAVLIAGAVFTGLTGPAADRPAYTQAAEDAANSVGDPEQTVREAHERAADAQRRLDSERQILQEVEGRRARLAESVLYDTAGSRIDTYARDNRATIESRLKAFGFTSGEPVATYKDLVRDVSANSGFFGRVRTFMHALWAFRGQLRLIMLAIFFALAGWGISWAQDNQSVWTAWFNYEPLQSTVAHVRQLLQTHGDIIVQAAFIAAAGALLLNIYRALRFLRPLYRGRRLLMADIEDRRGQLDASAAAQHQRIADLARDAEVQAKRAQEIDRRAAAAIENRQAAPRSPFAAAADGSAAHARAFLSSLAGHIGSQADGGETPQRILVAIDNLEARTPEAAAAFLRAAANLLSEPCYFLAAAADAKHLSRGLAPAIAAASNSTPQAASEIEKLFQVPLRLDQAAPAYGALVKSMLNGATPPVQQQPDASRSALDANLGAEEAAMLEKLADVAGRSPRQVKRFVNLYRLARGEGKNFAALGLVMAIETGGGEAERKALEEALRNQPDEATIHFPPESGRLHEAARAAEEAHKGPLTAGDLRTAQARAGHFIFAIG